jgi:AraC-like DNA-binding protein
MKPMIFETHIPESAFLRQFASCFIYYEGFQPAHPLEKYLPNGQTELIINLTGLSQHIYDNITLSEIQECNLGWFSGIRTQPITIPSGFDTKMLVVVFRSGMSFPFFSFPTEETTNYVVEADLIWGRNFHRFYENLHNAESPQEKFNLTEKFLLSEIIDYKDHDFVEFITSRIIINEGTLPISDLINLTGFSNRHFISKFKKLVGITPKTYSKITRFQSVITKIHQSPDLDWISLALEAGFYDQAHFIKDFREMSGFTPEQYLEFEISFPNYVPIS